MKPITLLIADDQMLLRQALEELLMPFSGIGNIVLAKDGEEALTLIKELRPDVALLDVRMPKRSGVDVLKTMTEERIPIPVLLLTTFNDHEAMIRGLSYGAKGYLLKDVSAERLYHAIKLVSEGGTYISPTITERIAMGVINVENRLAPYTLVDPLTTRETEVIRLVGAGLSNKDIAHALDCKEGTIRNHMSSIISKLGVRDRTQALLRAIDEGLI